MLWSIRSNDRAEVCALAFDVRVANVRRRNDAAIPSNSRIKRGASPAHAYRNGVHTMSAHSLKNTLLTAASAALIAIVPIAILMPATAKAAPPLITSFSCSNLPYGPEFTCVATYSSNFPATALWSGAEGTSTNGAGVGYFFGQCANGDSVMIRVTVSNADGSATASTRRYRCIVS
jgi:hypothetical protein